MSQEPPDDVYSSPLSGGGLFLRVAIGVALLAAIGGVIWLMSR